MAKYQKYAEYKDSSVEWLGEIPSHWDLKPSKFLFNIVNGSTPKSGVEEYWEGDITWVTPSDLSKIKNFEISESARNITNKGLDSCGTSLVPNGSLILSCRAPIGSLAITTKEVCTNQGCKSLVVKDKLNTKFVYYFLSVSTEQLNILGRGTTFLELSSDELGNFKFPFPTINEQFGIANFLDHETAKIDTLIAKQEKLIELLKEKRQAVISHAVTKGLNPNVPMKDSGVEWLGEVPEHWIITKLKWKAITTSGSTPTTSKYELYYENGNIPWIRTTDLNNGDLYETPIFITPKAVNDSACSVLPVNSILIAMYGGAGSIGKHSLLKFESTINQAVCGILPSQFFNADFLHCFYEFYRPFWMIGAAGTRKDPNIGQDHIKESIVPLPPLDEQAKIVKYLLEIQTKYDDLTEKAESAIQLMQERRTALISAAVTGKIDVRNWQHPNQNNNNNTELSA